MNRTAQIATEHRAFKVSGGAVVSDADESIGKLDGTKDQLKALPQFKCAAK